MSDGGALRQIAAEFGFNFDTEALARGGRGVDSMIARVGTLGTVIAGASGAEAILRFADSFSQTANTLRNTSTELGISTDQLQAMGLGFADAGVSSDELTMALRRANRAIGAAAHGGKQQAQTLHALGVSARGAHGEIGTLSDLLPSIMDGFAHITNPAEAAQRANDLFGRGMGRLVPILQRGSGALAEMQAALREAGGGITENAIDAAHHYEEAQHRLDVVTMGLKASIAEGLLPALEGLMAHGGELVTRFHQLTDGTDIVKHTLEVLGGVGLVVGAELLLPWVPLLAAVALGIIAYDDLKTTIAGGDSVTRRFIDGQLGVGATADIIAALAEVWGALKVNLREIPADLQVIKQYAIDVGQDLSSAFQSAYHWAEILVPGLQGIRLVLGWMVDHAAEILHVAEAAAGVAANASGLGGLGVVRDTWRLAHPGPSDEESRGELVSHITRSTDGLARGARGEFTGTTAVGGFQSGSAVAQAPLVAAIQHVATVASQPRTVTNTTTISAPITVTGANRDPHEIAAAIDARIRALREEHANNADGDHPVPGVH